MTKALSTVLLLSLAPGLMAQNQFLVADRDSKALFRAHDVDGNGVITDPGELHMWFDAANAPGTVGPNNPTALAISACGVTVMGDQGNQLVYRLIDLNEDGDAQDLGESIVFADATNSAGISFAFPTGAAFDAQCVTYVVNAGNALGNDGIYRLIDLNGDGDAQDQVNGVHEVSVYVGEGAFGSGNGPFSPQEIFFDSSSVGYLRNSSANLHGIYRFQDLNGNGRADEIIKGQSEFTVFFDSTNASGVPISAGFPLAPDPVRPGAIYTLQLAAGGVDQLLRVADTNSDLDAQDAGEAVMVWT